MNLHSLIESASTSSFAKWRLNFILHRVIPFNKPHSLKVVSIDDSQVKVHLPYKRKNLNHIKGLHACAQTTAAEYASGLWLLNRIGFKDYRIIMKKLSAEYHYQAKGEAFASFGMSEEELRSEIMEPLEESGKVYIRCKIDLKAADGTLFSTVTTEWQIKSWEKVKTKI